MATAEQMRGACEAYVAALSRSDVDAVVALYAPDATVEDPVGSSPRSGHEAIAAFYEGAKGVQLELAGPVRTVEPTWAAFPFTVAVPGGMQIDVIDIFKFDDDGLITGMTAYWGTDNVSAAG